MPNRFDSRPELERVEIRILDHEARAQLFRLMGDRSQNLRGVLSGKEAPVAVWHVDAPPIESLPADSLDALDTIEVLILADNW